MITRAAKVLPKTSQIVVYCQNNQQLQNQVMMIQKRFKETATKKPCPEEEPKKARKLLPALGMAVIGTTVAVIAAKHDDDFRGWAKENFSALDNLVKIIYEKEETYPEFVVKSYKEITQWIKQMLFDIFKGSRQPETKTKSGISEGCEESKKPYKPPASAFLSEKVEEQKDAQSESATTSKPVQGLPKHIKELRDLEDKLGHTAQDTIQAYHAVVCAIKDQASFIDNLDKLVSKHDCKLWEKLEKKMKDEKKFLDNAEEGMATLERTAEKLKSRLDSDDNLTEDMKTKARSNLIILTNDVKKAKDNLEKEKIKNILAKRSWDKVRQGRMYFTEELETLFPNVWLNDEKLDLPLDSLGPFIQNVIDNIIYMDKELAELQTVKDAQVTSAIETLKSTNDSESLIAASVCLEGGKEKRFQQEEMQKKMLTHQAKCEKNARSMMKQQAEVYADLKSEALTIKEREVERRMQQMLEEKLANLRAEHKVEIAKLVGRIQGANEAIAQRGGKDKDQQEKQQFWSAAQSLLAAIKPIGQAAQQNDPKPLKNEISNVSKAAPEKDEFVKSVLDSIPQQAVERGLESLNHLKERFITVEQEARKVAAVPNGEVTLLQLFLARLQSALYITEAIPQTELDNKPFSVDQLNNYEILQRARHYVNKWEFDMAVRYLNLLKGPSVKVASDWVKDVVVYLETQQAAETLLAHASAGSIQL